MMLLHIVFIGGAAGSLMGSVWLFTSAKKSYPETWSSRLWLETQEFRLLVSRNLEHGRCLKNSKRSDQAEENCISTERYY